MQIQKMTKTRQPTNKTKKLLQRPLHYTENLKNVAASKAGGKEYNCRPL